MTLVTFQQGLRQEEGEGVGRVGKQEWLPPLSEQLGLWPGVLGELGCDSRHEPSRQPPPL